MNVQESDCRFGSANYSSALLLYIYVRVIRPSIVHETGALEKFNKNL
jgi:hypothetical protein